MIFQSNYPYLLHVLIIFIVITLIVPGRATHHERTGWYPDILESIFSEEMEKSLNEAIETLPEQCRQIFYLCRFEDLSYREISAKLDISLSTVKTQMQRAMVKLAGAVKDHLLL